MPVVDSCGSENRNMLQCSALKLRLEVYSTDHLLAPSYANVDVCSSGQR